MWGLREEARGQTWGFSHALGEATARALCTDPPQPSRSLETAASFPLQGGMSQALPTLVQGQRFQSDLLDSQQAVYSCLEDRIPASTDNGLEADGRLASQ